MNFTVSWMNESYFESMIAIFDKKSPFCLFWTLFGQFFPVRLVSIIPWLLNWIVFWIESAEFFFELNNILNWILGKAILNRILNESFFVKIQTLNWIRSGIEHPYDSGTIVQWCKQTNKQQGKIHSANGR